MTGSGLAAQPSQSLENIARGTRRSMGQFIPQYRTDGQYWIDHTKTWACGRKGNRLKRYEMYLSLALMSGFRVKRTCCLGPGMSASDPKRTSASAAGKLDSGSFQPFQKAGLAR